MGDIACGLNTGIGTGTGIRGPCSDPGRTFPSCFRHREQARSDARVCLFGSLIYWREVDSSNAYPSHPQLLVASSCVHGKIVAPHPTSQSPSRMPQLIRSFRVRLIHRSSHDALLRTAHRLAQRRLLHAVTHPAVDLCSARTSTRHHLIFNSVPFDRYAWISDRPVDLRWHTVCHVIRDARISHFCIHFRNRGREGWFIVALPLFWLTWPGRQEARACCAEAWIVCAG